MGRVIALITPFAVGLPLLIFLRVLSGIDRFEREPTRYVIAAVLWGAVPAVILGLVAQLILGVPVEVLFGEKSLGSKLIESSLFAPLTEETLKAGALALIYLFRRREFDGWVDGVVYGAAAGFGFAFVEDCLYLIGSQSWGDWVALYVLRVFVFGFLHGFWTSLVGIGFGLARNRTGSGLVKVALVLGMLALAMLSHFAHNTAVTLIEASGGATFLVALFNYAVVAALFIGLAFVAADRDRLLFRRYLADEVPMTLKAEDFWALSGLGANAGARLRLISRRRRALIQAAAELAQRKRQYLAEGNRDNIGADIVAERARLAQLSALARE